MLHNILQPLAKPKRSRRSLETCLSTTTTSHLSRPSFQLSTHSGSRLGCLAEVVQYVARIGRGLQSAKGEHCVESMRSQSCDLHVVERRSGDPEMASSKVPMLTVVTRGRFSHYLPVNSSSRQRIQLEGKPRYGCSAGLPSGNEMLEQQPCPHATKPRASLKTTDFSQPLLARVMLDKHDWTTSLITKGCW